MGILAAVAVQRDAFGGDGHEGSPLSRRCARGRRGAADMAAYVSKAKIAVVGDVQMEPYDTELGRREGRP
jgi:hypothetical protein